MIRRSSLSLMLVAAFCVLAPIGCTSSISAGEIRRRSLFRAMLWAWVLGLAVIWRWWGRPRSKPPQTSA